MMTDALLQLMVDEDPVGLKWQLIEEMKKRTLIKIASLNDDDLMEAYDYVGGLATQRRRAEREAEEGGER